MKKLLLPLFLCAATTLQTNDFLIAALELAAMLPPSKTLLAEEEHSRRAIAQHRAELLKAKKEKADQEMAKTEDMRQKHLANVRKEKADAIALKETEQKIMENIRKNNEEATRRKEAQRKAALTGPTAYQHDPYAKKFVSSEEDLSELLPKEPTEAIDTKDLLPSAPPSSHVTPSSQESAFGQQTEEEADLFNDLQQQQQQVDAVEGARKSLGKWATYAKEKGKERKAKEEAVKKIKEKTSAKKIQKTYKKYKEEKEKKERLEKAEADRKAQTQSSSASPKTSIPSSDDDFFATPFNEQSASPSSSAAATPSTTTATKPLIEEEEPNDNDDTFGNMPENFFDEPTAKGKSQTSTESHGQLQEKNVTTEPVDFTPEAVQPKAKTTPKEKTDFETATEFVNTINKTEKLDLYKQAVSNFCAMMFDVKIIDWQIFYSRPQFTIKPEISQHTTNAQLTELINNAAETIKDKFSADNNKFKAQQWTFLDSKNRTEESSEISGNYLSTFILESLPKQESHEPFDDSTRSSDSDPDDL